MAKNIQDKYGPSKYGPNNVTKKGVKTSQISSSVSQYSSVGRAPASQKSYTKSTEAVKLDNSLLEKISNLNEDSRKVLQETSVDIINQLLLKQINVKQIAPTIKIRVLEDYPWNNLGPESEIDDIRFLGRCKTNTSPERVFVQPLAIRRDGKWYSVSERIAPSVFHNTGDVQSYTPTRQIIHNRWPKQPQEKEYGIWGIEYKINVSDDPRRTNTILSGKKVEPYIIHKVNVSSTNVPALKEIVFDFATKQFPEDDRQLYLTSDNVLFGLNNGRKVVIEAETSTTFSVFKSDEILETRGILFLIDPPESIGNLNLRTGAEKFKRAFRSFNDLIDKKLTKLQLQTLMDSIDVIESNDLLNEKASLLDNLEKLIDNFDSVNEIISAFSKLPRFEADYLSMLNEKLSQESHELKQIRAEKEELERQKSSLTNEISSWKLEVEIAKSKNKAELEKFKRNLDSRKESMQRAFDKTVDGLVSNTEKTLENVVEFKFFHDILTRFKSKETQESLHPQMSGSEIKVIQQDNQNVCQLLEAGTGGRVIGRRLLAGRYDQLVNCISFLGECGISIILSGKCASPIARALWSDKERVVAKCPYALNRDLTSELLLDGIKKVVILNANLSPIDVYLEEFVYRYLEQIDDSNKRLQALLTFSESPLALQGNSLLSSIAVTINLDTDWNKQISDENILADFNEAVDAMEKMKAFLFRMYPELNSWSLNKMCDYLFDETNVSTDYDKAVKEIKNLILPFIYGKILATVEQ